MTKELSQIIASTQNGRLRIRLLAVSHFIDGKNRTKIAKYLKVSRTSVNNWDKYYLDQGIVGLQGKKHTGRPKGLTEAQLTQLKHFVVQTAVKPDSGRLQGKDVQAYIACGTKNKLYITYFMH